jgi:hypothetical protein
MEAPIKANWREKIQPIRVALGDPLFKAPHGGYDLVANEVNRIAHSTYGHDAAIGKDSVTPGAPERGAVQEKYNEREEPMCDTIGTQNDKQQWPACYRNHIPRQISLGRFLPIDNENISQQESN